MSKLVQQVILVVEDDPGVAALERKRLERAGYLVVLADSAETALKVITSQHIDLIVLDYRLPGDLDGLEFYSHVRESGHDVPVILVTGFGNEATVIKALRAGVRDFVTKSAEYLDYLPEAVTQVLRQVQTEHQLVDSEARLAAIIATAKDAIIIAADDERITLFNAAAEKMFRCNSEHAIGRPISDFIPRELRPRPKNQQFTSSQELESLSHMMQWGTRGIRPDGSEFPLEATVSKTTVTRRKFYTVVVRDITERLLLENQFRQAQKMEAIGVLAGGVAHDFNNLLTVIMGFTEVLLSQTPAEHESTPLLQQIARAGERAALLTRQLLTFGRKQPSHPRIVNLNAIIAESERMLRKLAGANVSLACSLDPRLWKVKADSVHIEQMVMNIVINARDAMPHGGHLTIETANVDLDEAYVHSHPQVQSGPYAMLAISDTGFGMTDEVKTRIFEPFFTTKEVGKGTGLGLATVFGIVKQHQGYISVYSEVGRGTTFKIYFPPAEGQAEEAESPDTDHVLNGDDIIMLVEDEEGVRKLIGYSLRSYGYTVIEAKDGAEALELSRQYAGPIHLLITDLVMPRMGGRALAEAFTNVRKETKVLHISGYADDAVVRHGMLEKDVPFLQKPFTPAGLARKVREILGIHTPVKT